MSGTIAGSRLAAQRIKEKYGEDHYRKIGAKGGKSHNGRGGFYFLKARGEMEKLKSIGRKGGSTSRRRKLA